MHIELTPEQYATLCAKAKKSGLTKRALIIRLLEGQEIRERPTEEIRRLREEVHRIGTNINQIARSVNEGIATPEDAGHGLYMLDTSFQDLGRLEESESQRLQAVERSERIFADFGSPD